MKIYVPIILSLFFTLTITAQDSFFETLDKHGENAEYVCFGNVYKDDKGKQVILSQSGIGKMNRKQVEGINSGFIFNREFKDGDTALYTNLDYQKGNKSEFIGFPNTAVIHTNNSNNSWVAIDNYLFELDNLYDDYTNFKNIVAVFLVKGTASKGKKKKKKGAFWKQLKDAALNQPGPADVASGPEYDMLMELDLEAYVKEYLLKMKKIRDSYILTSKDKADLKKLKDSRTNYNNYAKAKNDAYWASPEGQAILENRRRAAGASKQNDVTLRNNSSVVVYVGSNGSRNQGTRIDPGSTASWSCSQDAYIQSVSRSGSSTSYASTSSKVYTGGSGCGSTININ